MFEALFYLIYVFLKKIRFVRTPVLSSYLYVCILMFVNLEVLHTIICYLLKIHELPKDVDATIVYPFVMFIIMVVNYFYLYARRQVIFEKYNLSPKNQSIKRLFFLLLYVVLSVVLLFIAYAYF